MATRNINLTDRLDRFIDDKVGAGEFQNASEVVRAGLRLLSEQDDLRRAKIEALKAAVQVGLDQADRGETVVVEDVRAWVAQLAKGPVRA